MTRPLVSIVTPSYNQAQFLEETIVSILDQDYPNIEYVVVDDGSTDGSPDIIGRYADRLHWWTQQENAGQVAAINRGFEHTSGALMTYINSDDTLLPGRRVGDGGGVRGGSRSRDGVRGFRLHGRGLESNRASAFARVGSTRGWCATATTTSSSRARCGRAPRGSRRDRSTCAATTSSTSSSTFASPSLGPVKHVARPWSTYREHVASKSAGDQLGKSRDYLRFADEFLASDRLPEELRPYAREGRARARVAAANNLYGQLELGPARRWLWEALTLHPRSASRRSLSLAGKSLLPKPVVRRLRERRHAAHRS